MSFPHRPELPPDPDDDRLQQFLRQHAPTPPAVSPDLEAQIMASIQSSPQFQLADQLQHQNRSGRKTSRFVLGVLMTAAITGLYGALRLLTPAPPTAVELAQMQSFVEVNWNGVLQSGGETNGFWRNEL